MLNVSDSTSFCSDVQCFRFERVQGVCSDASSCNHWANGPTLLQLLPSTRWDNDGEGDVGDDYGVGYTGDAGGGQGGRSWAFGGSGSSLFSCKTKSPLL